MAMLARKRFSFKLEHDVELGRSVDCATFMIHEMRLDPSVGWFDYKTHSAGLKYEFCLAVHEPRITWISGPRINHQHTTSPYFVVEIPMKTRKIGINMPSTSSLKAERNALEIVAILVSQIKLW